MCWRWLADCPHEHRDAFAAVQLARLPPQKKQSSSEKQPATEPAHLQPLATLTAALLTRPKCRKSVPAAATAHISGGARTFLPISASPRV
jgi:hypothetical protein